VIDRPKSITLAALFDTSERDLTPGSKEANTRATERTNRRNLIAHFGAKLSADALDHRAVQEYVNASAAEGLPTKTLRLILGTADALELAEVQRPRRSSLPGR
jgi:hypothetical protein